MADSFDLAPKIELHLHLEGAIPRDALWELVSKHGGDPGVTSRETLADRLHYTSFAHFIETWWWMTGFVRSYDDFEYVAAGVAADLARQNIIYAEASFSPTDFERHGLNPQGIAHAIRRGLDSVPSIQVVLNCDLVRDTGPNRAGKTLSAVLEVAEAADVRGITIGGSEQTYPPGLFTDVFDRAAAAGLHRTAHAGEAAGPQSVWDAIEMLGVERIGHGVRAVEDRALVDLLVDTQLPLEVCPTSNLRTGVVAGWDTHPVGTLLEAGAAVTISSDDPTFFHTSVAADLRAVADRYDAAPRLLTERAIRASWMTDQEKEDALTRVTAWWDSSTAVDRNGHPTQ